ncbi:MAG: enoyl-CoA hydratase/isomerase family protein [Actinomycetota bacterium]|nr:enoyl-CoA hydratase/isomerase family protein [Actinomycetota bacterium]
MAEPVLTYEVDDQIAYITLNRPQRRNALNDELSRALIDVWPRFEADPDARVGILRGAGQDFCVGLDLNPGEVRNEVPHLMHQGYPRNGTEVFKPLIAAVQGNCMGGGYAFAVRGCDFTIMADTARLGFPEARAGIAIAPIDYIPLMPFKISLEFMMLAYKGGRFMDADRAYQLGLVNEVVPEDELDAAAIRWAEMLKTIPQLYIKAIKYGHYKAARMEYLEREMDHVNYIWPQQISGERREAAAAMREKRDPDYGSPAETHRP